MVAITLIEYYQRYLSPYKGFSCPHRTLHGGRSCSEQAKRILRRAGLRRGLVLLERRLLDCRHAAVVLTQTGGSAGGPPPVPGAVGGKPKSSSVCGSTCETVGCGFQGLEIVGDIISCFG